MFLSKLSVNRPVTITMFILVFVVFGVMAFMDMNLETIPNIELPYVTVMTVYPGAGPAEVESQVTNIIEDAVSTVSRINMMQSFSMDNASIVMIEFEYGKDVDIANQEVKDKVDAVFNDLPEDVYRPTVSKIDISAMPVIQMVLSGTQSGLELYEYADKTLRDRLAQIEGVASVDISGGQEREIQVVVSERTVFANNISLVQLSQILAMHNMDLPSGSFTSANQELNVRVKGQIRNINELRDIEIPTAFGSKKLSEIAEVRDTGNTVRKRSTFFNLENNLKKDNVINISLIKGSDGNPVQISRALHRQLRGINESLPSGMELDIINDSSDFVQASVDDTMSNIYLGILFTGLVLLFFLHDLRSTLIVAIAMPVSIISSFTFMKMAGFTLNIMSLLGLSTSVGVLVANSIVVLENIFRHKELGHNRKDSAEIGTSEIAIAVLASTMTNICVFLPIGTMGGILGQMLGPFGLTVTIATIFSLLIAFTLTPMLASVILPKQKRSNKIADTIEGWMSNLEHGYQKILNVMMKRKLRSFSVILGSLVLLVLSFFAVAQVGFEFSPSFDQGDISISVELPLGYDLNQTAQTMLEIESLLSAPTARAGGGGGGYPEIKYILTNLGSKGRNNDGLNLANMAIKLVDADERTRTTKQVADQMIRDLSHIPNVKILVSASSGAGPGGGSSAIQLYVSGLEDGPLVDLSNEVMDKIRDIPGLINLDTSVRTGRPEITIEPKRDQLALTGNTVMELALAVRAAMEGMVATQYREYGQEYDIIVTMPEDAYNSPEKLKNLTVITSRGKYQLSQLAEVYFSEGVNRIIHIDKAKTIQITGDPASGVPLGNVTGEITRRLEEMHFPDGYRWRWSGNAQMMNDAVNEMARAAILAILLTYMLLAAILESFVQPFMILFTIPLALIGIFFIQFITGMTMNIVSMMAIIMLIGIVVNNAILILDYANQLIREKAMTVHDALLEAAPTKIKPILMANIAIILGMIPMAVGLGSAGKEFRQAMGIVSVGGLISSTLLTLFVIPALYYLTTKEKKVRG